jgi:hypothetical protein
MNAVINKILKEGHIMKKTTGAGIFLAVLAAALYAINSPFSNMSTRKDCSVRQEQARITL